MSWGLGLGSEGSGGYSRNLGEAGGQILWTGTRSGDRNLVRKKGRHSQTLLHGMAEPPSPVPCMPGLSEGQVSDL